MHKMFIKSFDFAPKWFSLSIVLSLLCIPLLTVETILFNNLFIYVNENRTKEMIYLTLVLLFLSSLNLIKNNYLLPKTTLLVHNAYLKEVNEKVLNSKYDIVNAYSIGEFTNIYNNITSRISNYFTSLFDKICNIISLIMFMFIVYRYINKVLFFVIVFSFLLLIFSRKITNNLKELSEELNHENGKHNHLISNTINNIVSVQAYNKQDYFINKYKMQTERIFNTKKKIAKKHEKKERINELFYFLSFIIIPCTSIIIYLNNNAEIGIVSISVIIASRISQIFSMISDMFFNYKSIMADIDKYILFASYPQRNTKIKVLKNQHEGIAIQNLLFSYGERIIFKGFNAFIPKSEISVVYGRTGVGKSTLLGILTDEITNYGGDILFFFNDDTNINITKLLPEPYFYNISIIENLMLGTNLNEYDIRKYVNFFDRKYSTNLASVLDESMGEGGKRLSTGQRKLLGYLQALLTDSGILLLDEPTSNLDKSTAEILRNDILKNELKKTILISTHDDLIINRNLMNNINLE